MPRRCGYPGLQTRESAVEISVQDEKHLEASRTLLPLGKRIYIGYLPKQSWDATLSACRAVRVAGSDQILHIPVRLLESAAPPHRFLNSALTQA